MARHAPTASNEANLNIKLFTLGMQDIQLTLRLDTVYLDVFQPCLTEIGESFKYRHLTNQAHFINGRGVNRLNQYPLIWVI